MLYRCFPCGSADKESACHAGDLGLIPGLKRSPGEGNSFSLQYSDLENSLDYSPWGCKELDMTGQLNNNNNNSINFLLDLWFYAIYTFSAFIELVCNHYRKKKKNRKNHVVILINAGKISW